MAVANLPTPPARGVYHARYWYRGNRVLLAIDSAGELVDWSLVPLDPKAVEEASRKLYATLDRMDPEAAVA